MICLISIPWFHPAYKAGGPIQSIANMVEQFSENITYKIFCSNTDLDGIVLPVFCNRWNTYNINTKVWYTSKKNKLWIVGQRKALSTTDNIIFINGIYSWKFNLIPLLFWKAKRKIVSVRGMLHPGALSQKPLKKKIYLFLWKNLLLHKKFDFHASNEEEKLYIENTFGKKVKVFVAQNFPRKFKLQSPCKLIGKLNLTSVALISPMKNHLLVLEALKLCHEQIEYNIFGAIKDSEYWQKCVKQIELLPPNISVQYHGDILPNKVEGVLSQSHVFILPSKSENFGHAFYEALSAGKPVITSNNTPWNKLKESCAGINISVEDIKDIVGAIKFFAAMTQKEFDAWSLSASKYAAKAIDIDKIKQQYKEMFFA
jgi:glycosyltransferase involved in cell wall biosynthesis